MQYLFKVSVETNNHTGEILAVYFQVRKGKAVEVQEFENGNAFANYGRKGELLGIELLAPCKLKVLDQIMKTEPQPRMFVRNAMPRKMLARA